MRVVICQEEKMVMGGASVGEVLNISGIAAESIIGLGMMGAGLASVVNDPGVGYLGGAWKISGL